MMKRIVAAIYLAGWMCLALCLGGCGLNHGSPSAANLTLVVRGVSGDEEYAGMMNALAKPDTFTEFYEWGAPRALFVLNFQSENIHRAAEQKLAAKLNAWRHAHPGGRLNLVGHSAGCGVVLGSLIQGGRLQVDNVILLAPSVSPGYPVPRAMEHIDGTLHAFVSDRDVVFLKYRTGTFGTYDNVRTVAAGNAGFASTQPSEKFQQHRYNPAWQQLGNDGGHFGAISGAFVKAIIAPLLTH